MDVRIPLFPLRTVLFPGQLLPLHIFEPRYREMIAVCLREGTSFGVALIKEGAEVGAPAEPVAVGTTARIAQVDTLPDGRMNILAIGESRFRIHTVHTVRPYLEATATLWRWPDEGSDEVRALAAGVRVLLQQYLLEMTESDSRAVSVLPERPLLLATAAGAVPGLPILERQRLLEMPTLKEMLQRETALLEQEHALLRVLRASSESRPDSESPFSPN
jgi:Lon protease-like protein